MKTARLFILVFFLGISLMTPSCGKKEPPSLPRKAFSLSVVDLSGEWTEGFIGLKGVLPEDPESKRAAERVQGCRVYYGQYPLDRPPCPGCPIEYPNRREFGAEVITEQGFSCKLPADKSGQIYFLKVHLIGPNNTVGPPSERVKVIVE